MKRQLLKCDDVEVMAKLYEECKIDFSKLRSKMRKGKSLSAETKKKLSELLKGKNNAMYGHSVTEFMTAEREKQWRQSLANRNLSGENNGMYGKHHTAEARKKVSEANKGNHWYNNGIVEIYAKSCPNGYVKGRLTKKGQRP